SPATRATLPPMRRSSLFLAPMALLLVLTLAACGNKEPLVYATPAQDIDDIEDDADLADDEQAHGTGEARGDGPAAIDEPAVDDADDADADDGDGDGSDPESPVDDAGPAAVPPATDPGPG